MASYDPYDSICAPQFVNFLSKSPEDDHERSLFFETAAETPTNKSYEEVNVSLDDKTITPEDFEDMQCSPTPLTLKSVESVDQAPSPLKPRPQAVSEDLLRITLSNMRLSYEEDVDVSIDVAAPGSSQNDIKKAITVGTGLPQVKFEDKKRFSERSATSRGSVTKRTRSPVPSSVRDYSLPPEKYISVTKHISSNVRLKNGSGMGSFKKQTTVSSWNNKNLGIAKKEAGVNRTKYGNSETGVKNIISNSSADCGTKVGRRPEPKVEPMLDTRFKRNTIHDGPLSLQVKEFKAGGPPRYLRKQFTRRDDSNEYAQKEMCLKMGKSSSDQEMIKQTNPKLNLKEKVGLSKDTHHPGVLYRKPFLPKKSQKQPTRPVNVKLHTELRAYQREEFDKSLKERMNVRDIVKQVEAEVDNKKNAAEIAQMRKDLVHKARPAPVFPSFEVKKSKKLLTVPETPRSFKKTCGQSISISFFECMDED